MSESFNPAWRTQEPPVLIGIEKIVIACNLLGMITYGVHIAVYLASLHAVLTSATKRHRWLQTAFITTLFAFATLYEVWDWQALVYSFVEYRNFPGGPGAFYSILASLEESRYDFGNFSAVIITWLSNAMLIWRCFTVWSKKWVMIVVPIILWIGSVVTGSITCYEAAQPQASLVALGPFNFNLSFWAISLTLNMLLTALILTRLLRARASAGATLGQEHGQVYMGIAAIIIESALLYAVIGFVFIVTYGTHPLDGLTIQQVLVQIEAISPELMVLRIARGRAWTSNTSAQLNTSKPAPLRFASTTLASRTDGSHTFQNSHGDMSMVNLERKQSETDFKPEV